MAPSDPDDPLGPTLLATDPPAASAEDPALAPTINSPFAALDGASDVSQLGVEHPGRYERTDELGRGGMGRVILAFDDHLGREVAMKELLSRRAGGVSNPGGSVGLVTRFLREARITGQLEHPGIVPVHELGRRADGTLYYTMKRIRGRALTGVLAEAKTIHDRLKLLIHFRHVCEAMAYAHSRGVVHRDLKPDNVMVGEFGETLIVDWGLAKVQGQEDLGLRAVERAVVVTEADGAASTLSGHAIGTPAYMSPEQARGDIHQIDERSDVWGLGAMLFELLTGRPPHTGDKALTVLHKVLEERPPRVLEVQPDAPRELAAIADRALLRDPSSRYPGAEALAAEIRAFQAGAQVHAYDYSGFETLRRFVSRHRAASVAVFTISLAILAATLVSYWQYAAERDARVITESRRQQAAQRRDEAEAEVAALRQDFAIALLERAESSLRASDPAAASIYAAGALLEDRDNPASPAYDPESQDPAQLSRARQRVARAFSLMLDAEDARRFVFVRRVAGSSSDGSLSPSGHTIVFPAGRRLIVEQVGSGERRALNVRGERVLTFLGDERVVLSGAAAGIYSLGDGVRLHELPAETHSAATLELPGGPRLALVLDDGTAIVLNGETYEELGRLQIAAAEPAGVTWTSPDTLMFGGHGQSAVELWDWPSARMRWVVQLPAPTHVIASSESGAWAALGQVDPLVSIFTPPSEQVGQSVVTHGEVTGLAWLRGGLLATAEGMDRVVVRNVERDKILDTLHVASSFEQRVVSAGGVLAVLPARDSAHVVAGSLFRFERHRQRRTRPLPTSVNDVCIDTRRRRILAATLRTIESFPTTTRGLGEQETLAALPAEAGHPRRVAVARDGAVAVVTDLGALLLVRDGRVETLIAPSGRVRCALGLTFGPRGDRIFVGSADGAVRRWRRSRGRLGAPVLGHEGAVCGLSLSPSGLAIASTSVDGTLRIWDAESGSLERAVDRDDALSDVDFAPDGERLAVADSHGHVSIVRRGDGGIDARFQAHEGWIERVRWSPDGLSLVTAGEDHLIRYGSADGERIIRVLKTSGPPRSVAVSPRGNYLFFHDGRTLVRLGASPAVDSHDPEALLRLAERRAGLRLRGLELVPTP